MLFNPVVGGKKLPALTDPAAADQPRLRRRSAEREAASQPRGKYCYRDNYHQKLLQPDCQRIQHYRPCWVLPLPGQQVCRHGDPGDAEHFRQFQWFDHRLRHPVRRICQLRHQECHEAAYHPGREDHYAVHIYANCRVLRQIHHGSDYRLRERQPDCRQYPGRREYLWGDRQSGLRRTILCGDGQLHR